MPKLNKEQIGEFIFRNVAKHPGDITAVTASHFNITRQAAHRHVSTLVRKGLLKAEGTTRSRKYALQCLFERTTTLAVQNLAEDKVWREHVAPLLPDLPANVFNICNYGFTEMVNNVIDHSGSDNLTFTIALTAVSIDIAVKDNGVGIFNKIQKECSLDDPLHSLLELSKGKLTTDPKRHSGEGIFFTSRMFDVFMIHSGNLIFARLEDNDFLLEVKASHVQGTEINMRIDLASTQTTQAVFDYFAVDNSFGFNKTIVPVFLSAYGDENLVSRSQAKRLLARFEVFKEVVLDFTKVESIGQAFADEVFRVFADEHPDLKIIPIRGNEQIEKMIKHVTSA